MKEIHLTGKYGTGKVALVDDEDYDSVNKYQWHLSREYAVKGIGVRPNRKKISMHRFIMKTAEGLMTDHVNGIRLDNRKFNLRPCTNSENQMNSKKSKKGGIATSEFKGVTKSKPWRATIGKTTIGYYDTEIEAAKAYDEKAKELYGEFAKLNFTKNNGTSWVSH